MIMISACLAGKCVRYDGGECSCAISKKIIEYEENIVTICPECMGGLSVPRFPCEISGGDGKDVLNGNARVINSHGEDVTAEFTEGAYKTLELALKNKPDIIYLKSKSPSCGVGRIYDGSFGGTMKDGNGVTAQLLIDNGFKVTAV